MKSFMKSILILLSFGSLALAVVGIEQPPGEPPFGVAVQGDAPGTKLNGAVSIEFRAFGTPGTPDQFIADARVVLRLRKGNTQDLETFFGDASNVDTANPGAAQAAITAALACRIIDHFFGDDDGACDAADPILDVKLKNIAEFGRVQPATGTGVGSIFVLADVQIAVR